MKRLRVQRLLVMALVAGAPLPLEAQTPGTPIARRTFALGATDFLLDGAPFQAISCELHPARIPAEYWTHRIRMAKAMGCNTVAAYVFWNHHETAEGLFDFATDASPLRGAPTLE